MLKARMNTAVSIRNEGTTDGIDRYGNATASGSVVTEETGWLEQQSASEDLVDRDTRTSTWLLLLSAETVATALSTIEVGGQTFTVVGAPKLVNTPRGSHHIEAVLKLQEG